MVTAKASCASFSEQVSDCPEFVRAVAYDLDHDQDGHAQEQSPDAPQPTPDENPGKSCRRNASGTNTARAKYSAARVASTVITNSEALRRSTGEPSKGAGSPGGGPAVAAGPAFDSLASAV